MSDAAPGSIGNRLAPARFIAFVLLLAAAIPAAAALLDGWLAGIMAGFDAAALIFLISCLPLLGVREARVMREDAKRNDANRVMLLAITTMVTFVILATVTAVMVGGEGSTPWLEALVIFTLLLAWLFSNTVYALHHAHLAYVRTTDERSRGLDFPNTREPVYADFVYFAFTLGMTFQTSDVQISDSGIRRTATVHSLAAFVFNIGVLAFTINVLGS